MSKQVLFLIGSPRGKKSTSESLGTYLLNQLEAKGMGAKTMHILRSLRTDEEWEMLISQVNNSDIIILAFPLYVDTLPAPVIEAMELILKECKSDELFQNCRLIAIANSGFPEPEHSDIALTNCEIFCTESGIKWAGGLRIGGGEAINGRPLNEIKGMIRNIIMALDLTAEALARNETVPKEAIELTSKPIVPKWLYLTAGTRRWKSKAKNNGVKKMLYDTPYAKK